MLVWLGENINMEEKIVQIINKMADYLNVSQMKKAVRREPLNTIVLR